MGYPIVVPISVSLKKYRPEQITVKELKADIHCWSGMKLPKCTKNYKFWSMKANFAVENILIFLSISQIVKGVFSKYFSKFLAST